MKIYPKYPQTNDDMEFNAKYACIFSAILVLLVITIIFLLLLSIIQLLDLYEWYYMLYTYFIMSAIYQHDATLFL